MDSLLSLYLVGLALAVFLIVGMVISGTVERWRFGLAAFLFGLLPAGATFLAFALLLQGAALMSSGAPGLHRNPIVVWGVFIALGLTIGGSILWRIRKLAEPARIHVCETIQQTTRKIRLALGAVLLVGMIVVMIFDPFGSS